MRMQNQYKTSDFQLASFLFANGIRLTEISFISSKRAEFTFEAPDYLDSLIQDFWNDRPSIGPLSLFSAQKSLKHRLYEYEYQNTKP
ncbi:hypothetical protein A2W70_00570 [Candidatus Curtissbacteria bacterium RIFCSPLOWO2_02_41_11]|uniref:DUF5659 domain-containing protein n=2 Tax=Candidatus Curtissiibacteriota TaxID=1752717 RepID=A0A1F5HTQ8_9BACT|nr:MAG: hypothetical protein UU56_C0014G0034 [Candidatus Curtissbacteria bacterium GW2011_GWA2_41_24]OGE07548.1 MAG: hypothetical protein A2W70_00570 [Candidatus Curtissbacteria bacterium RIFCSPLOWO2_02_41_11]